MYWGFPFYTPLGRELQKRLPVGTGEFSLPTRIVAEVMYWLYFFNRSTRGDLLIALATVS